MIGDASESASEGKFNRVPDVASTLYRTVDATGDTNKMQFKAIDAGIIQYLKQVHTELYGKLSDAVRSTKNKSD